MVLCWMMMPRSGGRKVSDALKIVAQVFERNLAAWREDNETFTGVKTKSTRKRPGPKRSPRATKARKPASRRAKAKK